MTRDDGGSFLGHLPLTRHPYEGKEQFWDIFRRERDRLEQDSTGHVSEWLLFEIDEKTWEREFRNTSDRDAAKAWSSFSASESLMLIKIGTLEHTDASVTLHDEIKTALQPMGLARAIQPFSEASAKGDKKEKKADQGWGPRRLPRNRSRKWPAVALEVAVSEPQSKLNSDVRFWLYESQGDTNIVLTLRVNRTKPEITIEKWELQNNRVHRTQDIAISKRRDGEIIVRGDPLVIEFEKLLCRPPSIPSETDIKLGKESLQALATGVWSTQDF